MKPTRPVLRYHGGKWRLAEWVISHFPPAECYVEPFGGGASVLMLKQPHRIEVYNDLDDCVVSLFRVLRDPALAEQLRQQVELTLFARSEFEACWERSDDPVEDARRLIVRSFQAIGAKGSLKRNGWRTRTAKCHNGSPAKIWNGWPACVPIFTERLREVVIEHRPYEQIIDIYDDVDTLFYLDPPYHPDLRDKDHKTVYAHELSRSDHVHLLDRAMSIKGMVALSGYPSPMYEAALCGWDRREIQARAQNNAPRTEVLWLNPQLCRCLQSNLFQEAVNA